MTVMELAPDEVEMILSARRAASEQRMFEQQLYDTVRSQCLSDGMIEVETGHFVRPGEPWTDALGRIHRNPPPIELDPILNAERN